MEVAESSNPLLIWLVPLASGAYAPVTYNLSKSHLINITKDTLWFLSQEIPRVLLGAPCQELGCRPNVFLFINRNITYTKIKLDFAREYSQIDSEASHQVQLTLVVTLTYLG